ncbi:zinc transporter foi [Ostrinia furnacalis]|uniref:zinc transporter foi n=1 Tax=Ostrinia furnacalis TaxID=93504 RepID=UPI0010398D62|nr:zinc transporter foi [Ostrinia furnacalis]XP_028161695.1 zinc transporter foi [Ostrinia furnacalis]XP_028161696.1 zinc transporter foi [Ostrinia furnacalis]XP_028161697.1 zinc transporter foi [Ostrinia furnacalis]
MSHHFVTVCLFCLLCAAHSCGSHIDIQNDGVLTFDPATEVRHIAVIEDKRKEDRYQRLQKTKHRDRSKRELRNVNPNAYVEKIFRLYGDAASMTMNLTGFNTMLKNLDLDTLVTGGVEKTENIEYIGQTGAKQDIVNCVSSAELITTVNTRLKPPHDHNHDVDDHEAEGFLSQDTLQAICPILLYQKLANTSLEQHGCVKETNLPSRRVEDRDLKEKENAYSKNMLAVWLYSCLSIAIISACGLLGVAVIPIMHKTYYNHLLQFLVALAVGTLCGDALLHLMPHAMSPIEDDHSHDHDHETAVQVSHSHDDGMWKGLAAMMGVVFFYFTEKGLTVVVEWRKRRQKLEEDKLPPRVRVLKDESVGGCSGGAKAPITNSTSNSIMNIIKRDEKGDPTTKTCKHKYSGYPYCYDEIDTDTHDDHHMRDGQIPPSPKAKHNNSVSVVSSNALNPEAKEEPTAKDWLLKAETPAVVEMNNIKHKEDGAKDLKDGDSYTVILREHSRAHHGHSHAHGHVHAPPSSMSSVAWMVIMGDGLHNFTDGMAIGAAFASNIAGGFSTAIAVLCHELPHELGDFAVLLKAGMSVKRAVCYNILSSALCLAGMVCGVLAGHAPSATRWLFAVAAGMFLYIALVDMMPELSTSHSKEGTLCQCILQLLGLACGVGIMLVIALYEHDLKNLFG